MAIITSLPITGKKIDELDVYGPVDAEPSKKDLIEVSKNEGTYSTPAYNTGGSRKVTLEELASNLSGLLMVGLIKSVFPVSYLLTGNQIADHYEDQVITLEDRYKYYVLSTEGRYQTIPWRGAYNLILPIEPPDGFCIFASFDCNGASTNDFDDYKFASGYTYLITWNETDGVWMYDRQKNIQGQRPDYIFLQNYGTEAVRNISLDSPNTIYICSDNTFNSSQLILTLPPLVYNVDCECTFILMNDMSSIYRMEIAPYSGDVIIPANNGSNYSPPLNIKKGTKFTFRAIKDTTVDVGVFGSTNIKGWALTDERIII